MNNYEKYFGTPEKAAETLADQTSMEDAFNTWADEDGALTVALVPPANHETYVESATTCFFKWLEEEVNE